MLNNRQASIEVDTGCQNFGKDLAHLKVSAQPAHRGGFLMRNVDQLLEGLEPLILAALDELCTLDERGVAQTIVLAELRNAIHTLQMHCDLDTKTRQRVDEALEMYQRISEVSALRGTVRAELLVSRKSLTYSH